MCTLIRGPTVPMCLLIRGPTVPMCTLIRGPTVAMCTLIRGPTVPMCALIRGPTVPMIYTMVNTFRISVVQIITLTMVIFILWACLTELCVCW